jgi:hypothetical protein
LRGVEVLLEHEEGCGKRNNDCINRGVDTNKHMTKNLSATTCLMKTGNEKFSTTVCLMKRGDETVSATTHFLKGGDEKVSAMIRLLKIGKEKVSATIYI